MPQTLHVDEIPIDAALVRALVARAMPQHAHLPVHRLPASGSSNALFRLGNDLLVRLPRQPGGSTAISKETRWLPLVAQHLPIAAPEVLAEFPPACGYPEHWSVIRWLDGEHPAVVDPSTPAEPHRHDLAIDLAGALKALWHTPIPPEARTDPALYCYRGEPLSTMDDRTRRNIDRCRALVDFELDLDAAERLWTEAMRLPCAVDRTPPRWYHADIAAENLLIRDGRLTALLDFGSLALGDPAVDLIAAWEILDPPARETFRTHLAVDDDTWLRGRAWALSIALMIWYYWTTMPARRASRIAVGRNILTDAGYLE
jgi:aminoglycoside phosphotransferase (APT) family kinase protein